ncbi:hypothetical protein MA16_Dca022467 [Dendrobium catenatum]|uniref:Uncharacterized protein n=1 Tax=Dendrobium catenatum TaxID=906689 RepID=A0A2I0VHJ8_9ASPA|nr:hypothetical protein MA16_Dca022467 [Dendrobium catenatum]
MREHIVFLLSAMEARAFTYYKEVVDSPYGDLWSRVVDEDMESLQKNATWKLGKLHPV